LVAALVLVTIVAITTSPRRYLSRLCFGLHREIVWRTRYRKLIWSAMHDGQHASEVVVWRRRRRIPLECGCVPGIRRRFCALEHAPEEIDVEKYLRQDPGDGRDGNEHDERMQTF